jgi:hypothetical protein
MTITRANIAKQLVPGLRAILGNSYGQNVGQHKALFDTESSVRAFEEMVMMTYFGQAVNKTEGSSIQYDDAQETYTARWVMQTIALGFVITEEAQEDNLYDTKAKFNAAALGRSMASTKETLAANVFNLGFSTAQVGGDGVPLFSASHPTVGGVNLSNIITGNPDLSESALQTAIPQIQRMVDDRGILLDAKPVALFVAPESQFTAAKILKTEYTTITATNSGGITNLNDINAIKSGRYFPKGWFQNNRFTDTDAFFIRTDVPMSTVMFQRAALASAMEGDFNTGNMRFKARERYSFGWGDWRGYFGSTGT